MGLIWEIMQTQGIAKALAEQDQRKAQLEKRVQLLEAELSHACVLIRFLLGQNGVEAKLFRQGPLLGSSVVKLAGTLEANSDGMSRQEVIRRCSVAEVPT